MWGTVWLGSAHLTCKPSREKSILGLPPQTMLDTSLILRSIAQFWRESSTSVKGEMHSDGFDRSDGGNGAESAASRARPSTAGVCAGASRDSVMGFPAPASGVRADAVERALGDEEPRLQQQQQCPSAVQLGALQGAKPKRA